MESTSSENMTRSDLKALIIDAQLMGEKVICGRIHTSESDGWGISLSFPDHHLILWFPQRIKLQGPIYLIDNAQKWRWIGDSVFHLFEEDDGEPV